MHTQAISPAQASQKLGIVPLPPLDSSQRYTVEEAARYLRTSRWTVFQMLRHGHITRIKFGRRTFIPGSEIARLSAIQYV